MPRDIVDFIVDKNDNSDDESAATMEPKKRGRDEDNYCFSSSRKRTKTFHFKVTATKKLVPAMDIVDFIADKNDNSDDESAGTMEPEKRGRDEDNYCFSSSRKRAKTFHFKVTTKKRSHGALGTYFASRTTRMQPTKRMRFEGTSSFSSNTQKCANAFSGKKTEKKRSNEDESPMPTKCSRMY
jgi:hypothetical protein